MKIKNVFMILLAAVLVMSMAGGVAAADAVTQDNLVNGEYTTGTPVPVTLTLEQSFTVTLPVAFNFVEHEDGYYADNEPFSVNVHRLNKSATLYVNVSSPNYDITNNMWNLTSNTENVDDISYVMGVTNGEKVHIGTTNLINNQTDIFNSTSAGAVTNYLHAKIPVLATELDVTGTYTDQLTFTIRIYEPVAP